MTEPTPRWATVGDVQVLTGASVTDAELLRAQALVELAVGRTAAQSSPTARLAGKLRQAVAYQAAWMKGQPDVFTRLDMTKVAQDGANVDLAADALILAPLAKRALGSLVRRPSGGTSVALESTWGTAAAPYYPWAEGVVAVHDYEGEHWEPLL